MQGPPKKSESWQNFHRVSPTPGKFGLREWWAVLKEGVAESGRDNLGLAAAGVAFYAFLALVPLLLSAVLIYGLVVTPQGVAEHVAALSRMLPGSATSLVDDQLRSLVETSGSKKGLGLLLALAIALFSARNGAAALVTALGIAYNQEDHRSFLRRTALALLITLAGLAGLGMLTVATALLTALGDLFPGLAGAAPLVTLATYLVLLAATMAGAGALYRYGPDRAEPRWRMVSAGSVFSGVGILVLTLGFGFYVRNLGNYDAAYGSLGAVIVLLTWFYLSAYVLLLGAEFNAVVRARARWREARERSERT